MGMIRHFFIFLFFSSFSMDGNCCCLGDFFQEDPQNTSHPLHIYLFLPSSKIESQKHLPKILEKKPYFSSFEEKPWQTSLPLSETSLDTIVAVTNQGNKVILDSSSGLFPDSDAPLLKSLYEKLKNIDYLILTNGALSVAGISQLLPATSSWENLKSADFSMNIFNETWAPGIWEKFFKNKDRVTFLDFSITYIGDSTLIEIFQHLPLSLVSLNLAQSGIGSQSSQVLAAYLRAPNISLKTLDCSMNGLQDLNISLIVEGALRGTSLTNLSLSNNKVGDATGAAFEQFLPRNTSLRAIDLSFTNMTDSVTDKIQKGVGSTCGLRNFYAGNNPLTAKGIENIGNILKKTPINTLGLGSIAALTGPTVQFIIPSLYPQLYSLDLSYSPLGDEGIIYLMNNFKKAQLKELTLSSIGDKGALALKNGLILNTSLLKLTVIGKSLSSQGYVDLTTGASLHTPPLEVFNF